MLKFSGFADLTSCLGREAERPLKGEAPQARDNEATCKMSIQLLAMEFPCALDALGARSSLTHKHAQLAEPPEGGKSHWHDTE